MNESGFTRAVNDKLPESIYSLKLSERFSAGVPDCYYSGAKDLWIEYKFYSKALPKQVKPKLSALQRKWLNDRYQQGRNVHVVVGSPTDCIIFSDKSWNHAKPKSDSVSRAELISWIIEQCK